MMRYYDIGGEFGVWLAEETDNPAEVDALAHNIGVLAIAVANMAPSMFRPGVYRDTAEVTSEDSAEEIRAAGIEIEEGVEEEC